MNALPKPTLLLILDGWGHSESAEHNAIHHANTPNFDRLWQHCSKTLISGSGIDVGLPSGQMGNSEVGHLNLGAGRVVYQDYTRITQAVDDHSFRQNDALVNALDKAQTHQSALHIMGLLSPGGVHSHEEHIFELIRMAVEKGIKKVYLHAFLDGRDMPPRSAKDSLMRTEALFKQLGVGQIASISGRYFAMDRDQRWERVEQAYDLMVDATADYHCPDAISALEAAYQRDENDEFVKPSVIGNPVTMQDNDVVVFMNYRADRARQMTRTFVDSGFAGFSPKRRVKLADFVMLTQYAADINTSVAYPPLQHENVLGDWLSQHQLKQLRIAETEKYAHVTFFFNGGLEQPFVGEERELIPSPKVATYDLQPEMNAPLMADTLVKAIEQQQYDVIIGNFANPDMVGHTGNFAATVQAIEAIDECLGKIVAALDKVGGAALITADHGNAEKMQDASTGQAHTAHTSGPVPLILVGRKARVCHQDGVLADVAPTLLRLLDMPIPKEMTGRVLFEPISAPQTVQSAQGA